MEAALTFGSVGDIIAICQLAIQLRHALQGDSAKDYRALRRDLDGFVRILMHVIGTYEQCEDSPWLSGLEQATKEVVEDCAFAIKSMLDRLVPKYQGLGQGVLCRRRLMDTCRRIEFSFKEKEPISRLNELLCKNTQRLTLLVTMATQRSDRVNQETLLARIAIVERHVSDSQAHGADILRMLREQSAAQNDHTQLLGGISTELQRQTRTGLRTLGSMRLVLIGIVEVGNHIGQLTRAVISLQMSISGLLVRQLDPTREMPVILEDSLGRIIPIPAQMLELLEWDTLHLLLVRQFERSKGKWMVWDHEYLLEDGASGRELERHIPLSSSLRRGMKVYMVMQFYNVHQDVSPMISGECPRCKVATGAAEGVTIHWQVPAYPYAPEVVANRQSASQSEGCGFSFQVQTYKDAQCPKTFSSGSMLTPASPADFQRVRVLRVSGLRRRLQSERDIVRKTRDDLLETLRAEDRKVGDLLKSSGGVEGLEYHRLRESVREVAEELASAEGKLTMMDCELFELADFD